MLGAAQSVPRHQVWAGYATGYSYAGMSKCFVYCHLCNLTIKAFCLPVFIMF